MNYLVDLEAGSHCCSATVASSISLSSVTTGVSLLLDGDGRLLLPDEPPTTLAEHPLRMSGATWLKTGYSSAV